MNQTNEAREAFCQRARQIEGVIDIRIMNKTNGRNGSSEVVHVIVDDLFSDAAWQVTQLQGDVHRDFPNTRIEVDIEDLQTYNLEDEALTASRSY